MKVVNLALRSFQFLMALLIMALIGNAIAMGAHPAINNYTMFCAAFAMLALLFLFPATLKEEWSIMPFLPFVLDLLLVIFWFCAAVALAAELGVHSCNNNVCSHQPCDLEESTDGPIALRHNEQGHAWRQRQVRRLQRSSGL